MFTRLSNFTYGNYQISNIVETEIDNSIELKIHIQKYEMECLRIILGDKTYNDFMSNVELDGEVYKLKSTADEKWGWLLNGKIYEESSFCGTGPFTWDGIIRKVAIIAEKEVYESLLAPYIFYHWSLNKRTLNLGTGEGKVIAQNTELESSKYKRIDAWNEFAQSVSIGYPGTRVSLNQFLCDFKESFPEAKTVCIKTLTYYDI